MESNAASQQTEQVDIEKLTAIVEEAIQSIAKATGLAAEEVIEIIEEVNVARLKQATQEAFKKISIATDLDTEEITDIFEEKRAATLDDIVVRLHEKSKVDRATLLSY